MNRKQGNQKKSTRSFGSRLMAMVLAFTLAFTSSGFISLAEESTEAAAVEQAAAEAAAAEQAAAEQAAAEQAAAEQAAAEQAAAEAAAAEQAAAEAAAAEQAAAEQAAAEAAAAEQVAAEAAAAEQAAAEQAAAEQEVAEPAEAVSEESAPEADTEAEPAATEELSEEEEAETEEETEAETEPADTYYKADADGISVMVDVPAGALPENAELHASRYDKDSAAYKAIEAALNIDKEETNLEALDIFFTANDEAVDPAESVTIWIGMSDFLAGDADPETLEAWQFTAGEEDTLTAVLAADAGSKSDGSVNVEKVRAKFKTASLGQVGMTWGNKEEKTEEEAEEKVYTAKDGGVVVTVTAPADAFPEDAELQVVLYSEDSEEYEEAADVIGYEEIADEDGIATLSAEESSTEISTGLAVVDISFYADGEEVEPSKPVSVVIDASEIIPEDADESSIEVQHLIEDEDGEVTPVVVASEAEVAEFEVESFSSFTITWAGNAAGGNTTSVTVYLYDINGLGIYDSDEQATYTWASGTHTIDSLISEHVTDKIGDGYTYAYATVQYLTTSAMGGEVTTIGSVDDPVVSISWNGSNYTVTTSSGSTTVASSDADEFYINLYFSTPMVSISVTGADSTNHTVSLTANTEYFQDSDIIYTWEITSGSEYASITGDGANATVTWNEGDESGTDITVKVTATSASGETATATYDLKYGMEQVTYTVYYDNGRTLAAGAHVAIYDENGKLVSNGETDENGQVTLWIVPGTTYTLEASYTVSSGTGIAMTYTHYTYEDTEYVYSDGDNTNIYLTTSDANFYEHVDVKLSIAEEDAGYSDILANVDYIRIYDEAGELVYQSSQMVHNEGTNDYNVLFADADGNEGTNPHSIAFYDSYSIEIAYEVSYTYTDDTGATREYTESYVATLDKNSTYMDGEYYSYNGTNAYQLYNEIYGTDYDATSFAAAVAASAAGEEGGLENYNANGISLDGLTYFYVAAALCDTKDTTNQAGLDLALGVTSMRRYSSTTWNFDVQKTLKNSGADAGTFSFSLYSATVSDLTWSVNVSDDYEFTLSNGTMTMADGSTDSVANMSGLFSFDYDSTMVGQTQTYYFVLVEDAGDDENITYSDAVYGVKVEVTLNSSTDMNDVTITETAYNLTESESSDEAYRTFTQGEEFDGSEDEDGYTIFPFVNEYDAKGSVRLGVTKTISGRSTTAKSFTFALYEADEDFNYSAETLIKDQSTTGTLTENEAQSVVFDTDIEYTEGGTYYYVIKEVTSSGNGWTCDGTEYHVTVTAANDGSGNIVPTEVTYTAVDSEGNTLSSGTLSADDDGVYGISGDSTLSFVNTYSDAESDVIFGGTKSITGTNSTTASFAFGLYDADENFTIDTSKEVHATTITGSGDFAFNEIDYTTAGTYYYVVKETTEDGNGWTVDGTEYHITVVVADATSDEGTGTFSITVSCTDAEGNTVDLTQTQDEETGIYTITGLDFENAYDASGSLNLAATKEYTGATLTANQFNFTITETTDGATYTGTGTNDADGNITFTPAIEYGLSDVGTHTYEIAETAGNAGGVTYDSNKITVTVEVADAGDGTLTTTVTVNDSEITAGTDGSYNVGTFNNTYEATGGVTLTATKTYTGATMTAGQFEFQIAETSGRYIGTGTNDANGNITFTPEITYTLDDVGTHTYRIVEVNGYAGGVTYDDSEIIVTVVVADNGDGTLSTTVTVDGEGVTAGTDGSYNVGTFGNSYEATGSVTFGGEKKISGKDEETSQQFTFELYTTDSDFTVAEDAEATDTQTVTGTGSFTFETISYDSDEEGNGAGTYYYVVKETATNENGWTSDTKEYRITVVVADAGNGTFALTVTCVDAEGQTVVLTGTDANGVYSFTGLDFTNEYEPAPTSVQFTGTKYITNSASDESTDKVFTFELYNADSSFAADGDAIQTKTTTGAGSITFDEIEYKETGTYYYVIQEKALDAAEGWTIDPTVYNITVEVTDDGLGQLVATVTEVTKGTVTGTDDVYGGFDFTNAYAAEGEVTLGVVKSISGVASTDKEFEFTLYNSDESFATGDSIETITSDGTITNSTELNFTAIPYTKAGTYYYVITETGTAPDGWTLDTTEYHVTVIVTDNGDGTLTTEASYAYTDEEGETQTENSAAFTNTYAATGELALTGTKTFVGGTLTEDAFTFTMTDSTGESVGDVTMDADGTITFPTLTYDETNIGGEYTYTITEVAGTDSSVQYDDTTYTVVVSVADNGDGTLDVTYTVNDTESGDITFTNYQKGSLTISKTFTGLTDEQIASLTDFTITVTNSDSETVATLTLDDADEDSPYTWTVSDLPADTYTVTETGYSLDGYEVISASGEVTVTDGSEVSVNDELAWGGDDTVEFNNDYTEVGSLNVSKYVVENSNAADLDVPYSVTITAQPEEGETVDLQWVTVTVDDEVIDATINSGAGTITFAIKNGQTVNISGLPVGSYTVEENYSATTDDFVPIYRVGEHKTVNAPTVEVSSDTESLVTVEIDNEFPVGTYIQVIKSYNGAVYPTGDDAFIFTIEALSCDLEEKDLTLTAEDMPMPTNTSVTVTDGNAATFGQMKFDYFGTYYYKITETQGSLDYVDYDSSVYYVKVVVTDSGETADEGYEIETVVESYAKADAETDNYKDLEYKEADTIVTAEFENTYSAEGGVTLTATKDYTGAALTEGLFNFTITETTADATYTGKGTNDADGNITFDPEITYTLDDVGTHTYEITETAGTAGGVTYDSDTITVTVVVTDNNDGTLATTVTVTGEGITAEDDGSYNVGTFENSYRATGSLTLGGTKTISGITSTTQRFEFALYATDGEFTVADDAEAIETQTLTGKGDFTFEKISYDSDTDKGAGTYYYVVKETCTDENGWTMDTNEYHITVVVSDAGNGTFILGVSATDTQGDVTLQGTTTPSGDYGYEGLNFENSYKPAPTSVQFTGSKYITNSASDSDSTNKVFTFDLYNADGSFATDGDAIDTQTTTGAGSITFDEITYEETGTYYYVIQEKALDAAEGWTIDPTVYNITVEVTDDGLGQLVATVTEVTKGTVTGTDDVYGGFDFTNAYAAEGEVTLGVVKSISGVASTDEEFEFTLYTSDESFAAGDSIETITTGGTISTSTELDFTAIPYTEAGTYYYVITETGTAPDGWTLDLADYHVTVTVTDNGDGTLTTSASYAYTNEEGETQTENSAAFTNTYAATGELSLTGTKKFLGGTLKANGFSFSMMDSTGESVGDVTMDADGTITFPTLSYDETDIDGEYTYTITEVNGNDSSVIYDGTIYTVIVSVADNGDGTLDISYTVNGTESGDITFTNYQLTDITVNKTWVDSDDKYETRPESVTVTITGSDESTYTLTLNNGNDWTATQSGLPLYDTEKGVDITYEITEETINGYAGTIVDNDDGTYTITNTLETVDIEGSKVWEDKDNQDGVRPDSITIYILNGNSVVETLEVIPDDNGNWSWVCEGLPKYDEDGDEINYRIVEQHVDDYTTTYTQAEDGSYVITNTHTPDKTGITVYKDWADNDNQDGKRAESVKVTLLADGEQAVDENDEILEATLSDANNWTYTFTDLDVYKDGEPIEYTIEEVSVDEYDTHITRVEGTNVIVIVNEHHPKTTDIEVQKFWDDEDDQDGIRPESIEVTMTGTYTDDDGNPAEIESVTKGISASTDWTAEFFELPIYAHHGHEIKYSISEVEVEGYTTDTSELIQNEEDGTYLIQITNTHVPETTEITVNKIWEDEDDHDGFRPESVEVQLKADAVDYGEAAELNDNNKWTYTWGELPVYSDGEEITYTVEEVEAPEGYEVSVGDLVPVYEGEDPEAVTGYTVEIINKHEVGKTEVSVLKIWDDEDDLEEIRPEEIEVQLQANGEPVVVEDIESTVVLDDDNEWAYTWTDLDKYSDGKEIVYTVEEVEVPDGYAVDISGDDETGIIIKNIHMIPEKEAVNVDSGSEVQVGDQIIYKISYKNGHSTAADVVITDVLDKGLDFVSVPYGTYDETSRTVTWTIENVAAGAEGSVYLIVEVNENALEKDEVNNTATVIVGNDPEADAEAEPIPVDDPEDPTKSVDVGDGTAVKVGDELTYTITYKNGHSTAADVTITDVLDDGLTFNYASDDGEYDTSSHTITWTLENVAPYAEGSVWIVVQVNENALAEGEVENTATVVIDHDAEVETNTVVNPLLIDIPVEKTWDDNYDDYGYIYRPTAIDTQLYRNSEEVDEEDGGILQLTEENDWSAVFEDLPILDENGELIEYSVEELPQSGLGRYYVPTVIGDMYTGIAVNNKLNIDFYPLDEEIVTDPDNQFDSDKYVKEESVNEWEEIEIEISTTLPNISAEDMATEEFDYTMLFHDQLSLELNLDEEDADFAVYIKGMKIDHSYYTVTIGDENGDGCDFEVEVNLTELYADGVITEADMGTAPIQIFFWADLEDADFGGENYYTSTTWYEVYQELENEEGELEKVMLYQSNEDVVYVYTYEINLLKYNENALVDDDYESAALAGATFGIYYDEECQDAVQRYDDPVEHMHGEDTSEANYEATSDENGEIVFVGLHEGTFYVKEVKAPEGFALDETVHAITLNAENGTNVYNDYLANRPSDPEKEVSVGDGTAVQVGDELTYTIKYFNYYDKAATVTITDPLDEHVEFISAEGGEYDEESHTVTWVVEEAEAQKEGSVEVTVRVLEGALEAGTAENTAVVQIGNGLAMESNRVENPVEEETGDTEPTPEPEPEDDDPAAPKKYVDADGDDDFHDNKEEVKAGDELTYKIRFYNNHAYADVVTITDTLDQNVEYVEGSASDDGFYDEATRTLTWYVGTEALTKGEVTFKVKVLSEAEKADGVANKAEVQIGSDEAQETNEVVNPVKSTSSGGSGSNPTNGTGTGTTGKTGTSGTSGSTASSVKTADETPVGPMATLMLAALAMMLTAIAYRRRRAHH